MTVSGEKEVEFSVPENQVDAFQQVNALKVGFWALPEVILDGKIREVAPSADKITRTYKVRVSLENPPPTVKLGMTAKVEAATSENAKVAVIPLTAVYQPGNSPQVWILQKDTVTLRPLKLGNYKENAVEVLDGLREGDIFVTAGVHKLQEGQMVNTAGDQP